MTKQEFKKYTGEVVRRLRRNNGLTQEELAQASGLHRCVIANVEIGTQALMAQQILAIGKALNLKSYSIFFPSIVEPPQVSKEQDVFCIADLTEEQSRSIQQVIADVQMAAENP